uniref:Uncharacterized protein n=1 Tax=Peronospora matthiolae TaxID=2874970 RepID=A0AAV1UMS1_9STRA
MVYSIQGGSHYVGLCHRLHWLDALSEASARACRQWREERGSVKAKDAYMFPLIGSGVLLGFYILFKSHRGVQSTGALATVQRQLEDVHAHLESAVLRPYKLVLSQARMLTVVLASIIAAAWFQTKHY